MKSQRRTNKKAQKRNPTRLPKQMNFSSARSRPRVSPDQLDVPLMFREIARISSAISSFSTKSYTPNAAYDVSPSVGSTETYGFDEYAALYSYYRVVSYKYEITACNSNSDAPQQSVMFYVLNTNTDPTVDGSRFDLYSTNPYCQSKLLSSFAGSATQHTFRGSHQVAKIAGDPTVETADSYRSLTTGLPSDRVWLTVGFEGFTSDLSLSLTLDVKIIMNVRFYSRENDLSLAGLSARISDHMEKRKKYLEQKASSPSAPAPSTANPLLGKQ